MTEQTDWADRWLGGFCTVGGWAGCPYAGRITPPIRRWIR
jgi:hypothetical protein